jgi:hypothetical protein
MYKDKQKCLSLVYPMTTCSNTPCSQTGSKEQLCPWIRSTKNQVGLKPHLIQVSLYNTSLIILNAFL